MCFTVSDADRESNIDDPSFLLFLKVKTMMPEFTVFELKKN